MRPVSFVLIACTLIAPNIVLAAEQKIIFNVESIGYKSNHWAELCQKVCSESFQDGSISDFMKEGWRIVSTSPKKLPGNNLTEFCSCIGTQFVIEKHDPISISKPDMARKAEELCKQENDLLKREVSLLKQENETLKAQIKSTKKKK